MSSNPWFVVFLATSTCLGSILAEASPPSQRDSLEGIPGVQVVIEHLRPEAQAVGLSEREIRTAVELILRSSGIPVLTAEENKATPSGAYIYVVADMVKNPSGLYGYSVEVTLRQKVSMVHRPGLVVFASTWDAGEAGTVGRQNLGGIVKSIESCIKRFANDFLTVNPH